MDEDSYTDIWTAIYSLRKEVSTLSGKLTAKDEEIQDLRLLLNVAQQTIKVQSMRIDAISTRIDDINRSVNELEGIKED